MDRYEVQTAVLSHVGPSGSFGAVQPNRAQVVLQDEDHIFAEANMDFHAQKDLPEFPFGALKRGEFLTIKVFVVYYLRDGKICRFKTSLWPTNFGVTDPPARGFGPAPPISAGARADI